MSEAIDGPTEKRDAIVLASSLLIAPDDEVCRLSAITLREQYDWIKEAATRIRMEIPELCYCTSPDFDCQWHRLLRRAHMEWK